MSKLKELEKELPILCQMKTIDLLFYAHMNCIIRAFSSISIHKAILNFKETYDLTEDEFNTESGKVTWNRMQKRLIKQKELWQKEN